MVKRDLKKIVEELKLPIDAKEKISQHRLEIQNILKGVDKRKIMIVGPCSAWPVEAVLDYAKKLKKLTEEVEEKVKIIMRVYSQKPRTVLGWSGILFQPDPFKKADVYEGVVTTRKMMLKIIELGLPIADEALFIESGKFLNDLYSYVALGARSSEDHEHRTYASNLPLAVGVKNPTSGDLEIAINSVLACQARHSFLYDNQQVNSSGNDFAHLILRGGKKGPNYNLDSLKTVLEKFQQNKVKNPTVIIDLNHGNSGKKSDLQPKIMAEVLKNISNKNELKDLVKGFMMESFLQSGKQDPKTITRESCNYEGLSITDDCLGWEKTEKAIGKLAEWV